MRPYPFLFPAQLSAGRKPGFSRRTFFLQSDVGYTIIIPSGTPHAGVMELVDVPHSKCGGVIRAGSSPATGTTSEQSPLCSDVFLCLWQKRRHPPAPLLLLSKSNPLRWASIWFWAETWRHWHLYCCDVPRRSKLRIACSDFFKSQSALAPLLLLSKLNPLRWASILFCSNS